jgi:hypothetical protein
MASPSSLGPVRQGQSRRISKHHAAKPVLRIGQVSGQRRDGAHYSAPEKSTPSAVDNGGATTKHQLIVVLIFEALDLAIPVMPYALLQRPPMEKPKALSLSTRTLQR